MASLHDAFTLWRARVRLAWAVLVGKIEVKSSLGLLLTTLTVENLRAQEHEIIALRAEIDTLRAENELYRMRDAYKPVGPYR